MDLIKNFLMAEKKKSVSLKMDNRNSEILRTYKRIREK